MLTGNLVRVRFGRDRVIPQYLDPAEAAWIGAASVLREVFQNAAGRTRGDIEEELKETFQNDAAQLVHRGLAKLLDDRCEFEVVAGRPPDELREAVFLEAAKQRREPSHDSGKPRHFDRSAVLQEIGSRLGMTPDAVEHGLLADLKSEQRLIHFDDISPERLVQRYNVALAQAVLLRATRVVIEIRGEKPQRYRALFRQIKFRRLICEIQRFKPNGFRLLLDGPLSLFSATQKYGLQLALVLPALLPCRDFDLQAELRWGPERKPKRFTLCSEDGLAADHADSGSYVPSELSMFADLFRKRVTGWDIEDEPSLIALDDGLWIPDFRLVHRVTGQSVLLDILGYWRRSSAERLLDRLRKGLTEPFILAVSDQLHIGDEELEELPALIHRFRQMPLPEEIAKLAAELVSQR
jgi:predicted nuclease of restriction endonuclease-like RecB superfamily